MKTNTLWKYSFTAFIISLLGCSFFFFKQKKTYTRLSQSANKLASQEKENLNLLLSAYKKKYIWINSLYLNNRKAFNTPTYSEMHHTLNQLNTVELATQADLNNFELLNINLNQALVKEVIKLNSQQRSLFTSSSQVRELERYDRHIDFVRTQYSSWSFLYYQTKSEAENNFFSKNNSLIAVPFYEIDHLILKKKKESKTL